MRKCPFCAEAIQDAAIKCKHCGSDVPAAIRPAPSAQDRRNGAIGCITVSALIALGLVLKAASGSSHEPTKVAATVEPSKPAPTPEAKPDAKPEGKEEVKVDGIPLSKLACYGMPTVRTMPIVVCDDDGKFGSTDLLNERGKKLGQLEAGTSVLKLENTTAPAVAGARRLLDHGYGVYCVSSGQSAGSVGFIQGTHIFGDRCGR